MKIGKPPTAPASVEVTAKDGTQHTLQLQVRLLGPREQRSIVSQAERVQMPDAAFLLEYVAGWEGITDEDGQPLPVSERAMARLLDGLAAGATETIVQACLRAGAEAARGN